MIGVRSEKNPSGLIYPIQYSDGEHYPGFVKNIQYKKMEKWNCGFQSFEQTIGYLEFNEEMKIISAEIAKMIRNCPQWQDWPVITPNEALNETQPLNFLIPRMQ